MKRLVIPLCILLIAALVTSLVLLKRDAHSYTDADIRAAFELGFTRGHEVGHVQGHSQGFMEAKETYVYDYDEGYEAGYEDGYWAGYAECTAWISGTAYEVGYQDGFLAGEAEAAKHYAFIAEDSYAHGYVDGYEDCSCGNPSIYPAQGQ